MNWPLSLLKKRSVEPMTEIAPLFWNRFLRNRSFSCKYRILDQDRIEVLFRSRPLFVRNNILACVSVVSLARPRCECPARDLLNREVPRRVNSLYCKRCEQNEFFTRDAIESGGGIPVSDRLSCLGTRKANDDSRKAVLEKKSKISIAIMRSSWHIILTFILCT